MKFLSYLEEFSKWGIVKSEIDDQPADIIKISNIDSLKLVKNIIYKAKIGFLLGLDTSKDGRQYYTVDKDYLIACLKAGADLYFLDYKHCYAQLSDCSGLILPGGVFDSPEQFYVKSKTKNKTRKNRISERSLGYVQSILSARVKKIPILGICAGAQMLGCMYGLKMYRSISQEIHSQIAHNSGKNNAHDIIIKKDSFLHKIMATQKLRISVNSRHAEAMLPCSCAQTKMEIYAVSAEDGIPEAWGNEQENILCIQWHPENLAINQQSMQNIYNWLVNRAQFHSI